MQMQRAGRAAGARAHAARGVVGFVRTAEAPAKPLPLSPLASAPRLEERATAWLDNINSRQLQHEELLADDCIAHDDGMWILQPVKGRTAIRKVWRDWLRSVPDFQLELVAIAAEPATNDAFILWRASGEAKLSLVPQRPTTHKPFEHYGVTRLRFSPESGRITDQWTWRGATTDEAQWLLTRSYKPFDLAAFREVFGAVPGADVGQLQAVLAADYACREATGVWRGMNLASREACIAYCEQRQAELLGSPYWHSEAFSADGRLMFISFQNVLMCRHSRTLQGLSSGILVHQFDADQRIRRSLMFRGPMSLAERSRYFNMDCRACGRSQAEQLGVDISNIAGM